MLVDTFKQLGIVLCHALCLCVYLVLRQTIVRLAQQAMEHKAEAASRVHRTLSALSALPIQISVPLA